MSDLTIGGVKVLIVEDNLHFRTLMRTILQALGVEIVEEARDGAEAIEVLVSFDADVAIIDWKMDGLNGIEFVRRIRKGEDHLNRFLPIIMVTGYTDKNLAKEAKNAGVNDFLSKPISAKSLLSRISSVLSRINPFVECDDYFGPDRRRQKGEYSGPERRKQAARFVAPEDQS